MLPTINGKNLLDCAESDFSVIINNADYRESEYIDYKGQFALTISGKDRDYKERETMELRNDVCAFANAEGGYIVWGVREKGGIPTEIPGITIRNDDTEHFENDLKNWLQYIQPKMPTIQLRFIHLSSGQFIVVLFVQHDFFAPYIHVPINDDGKYYVYKRVGCDKRMIPYSELKNMFMQSMVLEKEIEKYRKERSDYFSSYFALGLSRFLMLHVFPDTFLDSNYNKPVYALERSGAMFKQIFSNVGCSEKSIPTVDGIRCDALLSSQNQARLCNNGVLELFIRNNDMYFDPIGVSPERFYYQSVIDNLFPVVSTYIQKAKQYLKVQRVVVGISIIGLEGYQCEASELAFSGSYIDRSKLFCNPIVFSNIENDKQVEEDMKRLELDFYYSIGLQQSERMKELTKEIYGV